MWLFTQERSIPSFRGTHKKSSTSFPPLFLCLIRVPPVPSITIQRNNLTLPTPSPHPHPPNRTLGKPSHPAPLPTPHLSHPGIPWGTSLPTRPRGKHRHSSPAASASTTGLPVALLREKHGDHFRKRAASGSAFAPGYESSARPSGPLGVGNSRDGSRVWGLGKKRARGMGSGLRVMRAEGMG